MPSFAQSVAATAKKEGRPPKLPRLLSHLPADVRQEIDEAMLLPADVLSTTHLTRAVNEELAKNNIRASVVVDTVRKYRDEINARARG